jgi:3-keto-5-aminohexanoate cleavage enzyme
MIHSLIEQMENYGVNPELECFDPGMINYANYLISKGDLKEPYYFNVIFGNIATVQADITYAGLAIKDLPKNNCYWAFGGIGAEQLKMNTLAIANGGGVRVGLEDNIWFDQNRQILATNGSLLKRIHILANIFEREIMTAQAFGKLGFYNKKRTPLSE